MFPPALAIQQANDAVPGTVPKIAGPNLYLQSDSAGKGAIWTSTVTGGTTPTLFYADQATRRAVTLTAGMLYSVARQASDGSLWIVIPPLSGTTPVWGPLCAGPEVLFNGDYGALAVSYGLTVRHCRLGHLGRAGSVGTGFASWANQSGDGSAMVPGAANASNGIGSSGAGLNGLASVVTNGTSQNGSYTQPTSFAPGTTPHHIYNVERIIAGCTSSALYVHSGNANPSIIMSTVGTAELSFSDGASPTTTSGVVINQWYRLRASFTGSASDVVKVGAHAPAAAALGTSVIATQWGFGSAYNGTSLSALESLLNMHLEGPLANFLLFAADADGKIRNSTWSTAIEI